MAEVPQRYVSNRVGGEDDIAERDFRGQNRLRKKTQTHVGRARTVISVVGAIEYRGVGAGAHGRRSGVVDFTEPDDAAVVQVLRGR